MPLPGLLSTRLRHALTGAVTVLLLTASSADAQEHGAVAAVLASSAAVDSLPAPKRPPFGVGERALYTVHFSVADIGTGLLSVDSGGMLEHRGVTRLAIHLWGGLGPAKVDDWMASWVEPVHGTIRSLRFTQDLHEVGRHTVRGYRLLPDSLRWRAEHEEDGGESVVDALDDVSFLYWVRMQPLVVGRTYTYDRYFRPDRNPVKITVLRRERITVGAGEFDAFAIQPSIKTNGGLMADGGRAIFWISTDEYRMLLRLHTGFRFGSVSLSLDRFTPASTLARDAMGSTP
jgi:hypothetical protein